MTTDYIGRAPSDLSSRVGASAAARDFSLQRPTRLISASADAAMPEARSDIDVAPNAKAGRPNAPTDAAIGYSLLAAKGTGPRCLQLLSMWAAQDEAVVAQLADVAMGHPRINSR